MPPPAIDHDLRHHARTIAWARLVLVALGFGVYGILITGRKIEQIEPAAGWLFDLLIVTGILAVLLLWAGRLVRRPWQLALHLVGDLTWIGLVIYLSGGPSSTGVVLLFLVVLTGLMTLPGLFPFVLPAIASLVLAIATILYLANQAPLPTATLTTLGLGDPARMVSLLAVQVGALFTVDLLGQMLTRRLRESRIFTGELLDQLGEGVLAIDQRDNVVYANAEAVRLLDLGGSIQHQPVHHVLGDALLAPALVLMRGADCPALTRITGPRDRQLVLRVTALTGQRGKPIGRTLLIADETRQRLLEDNARRAAHLASLGEMAAGIAHEIRNPLTSLRGCAQELADMAAQRGDDTNVLTSILIKESDRLARIVEDFLSMSRLRPPRRHHVEVRALADELRQMNAARRDLPNGLCISIGVDPDCADLDADPDQIQQVLINLINNAVDALRSTPHPELSVFFTNAGSDSISETTLLSGPAVRITVRDNGCGIPRELHERIFTPFFSTKSQGTGLGLSMVGRIIREHEGLLHLASAPGKGTVITIHLAAHSQTRVFRRALGGG
jgi:two-component system sensor histidine kinase PilS (NtrC family)